MAEYDFVGTFENLLGDKQLALGATDVQNKQVETPDEIVERVQAERWLRPEQTLLTTSCGLNHLPREVAFRKPKAISDANVALRGAPTPA